jgi:hypothetical protein
MLKKLAGLCCLAVLASASAAHATAIGTSETFILSQDSCGGGCGSDDAKIVLTQTTATTVTVTETLLGGTVFVGGTGTDALDFNVKGAGTLVYGLADTKDFSVNTKSGPFSASPFGSFLDQVDCVSCSGSKKTNTDGPLQFTLTSATGVQLSDFVANAGGYYFSSEVLCPDGQTGDIAANTFSITTVSPVPEPSSLMLMGTGILFVAAMFRRRQQADSFIG